MEWIVIERLNMLTATWRPVAAFLVHIDAEDYLQQRNLCEPGKYRSIKAADVVVTA